MIACVALLFVLIYAVIGLVFYVSCLVAVGIPVLAVALWRS